MVVTTKEAVGGFTLGLSFVSRPYILATTVIISRVVRELSPGVTPRAATPVRVLDAGPIFSLVPATVNTDTTVIPVRIPVRARVGRPVEGGPTATGYTKVGSGPGLAMLSAPPTTMATPRGPPTREGVGLVIVVFSSPAPFTVASVFLLGLGSLFYGGTAGGTVGGTAVTNVTWGS